MATTQPPGQDPGEGGGSGMGTGGGGQGYGGGGQGCGGGGVAFRGSDIATLPVPGNAELVVYVIATIIAAIIALAADRVDSPEFLSFFMWVTAAYLISRGIAKASRVLER